MHGRLLEAFQATRVSVGYSFELGIAANLNLYFSGVDRHRVALPVDHADGDVTEVLSVCAEGSAVKLQAQGIWFARCA